MLVRNTVCDDFLAELYHLLPWTDHQRLHSFSSGSLQSPSTAQASTGQEQAREWGCTQTWDGFSEPWSQDVFLHLGPALSGKSNLPRFCLLRERPGTSKTFNANHTAGKSAETLLGVCFGFKRGSGSVSPVLLFVTLTWSRSHPHPPFTSARC